MVGPAQSSAREGAGTRQTRDVVRERPSKKRRLAPPKRVGRYVLGAALGRGGMGEVFAATDPWLGRTLAVKLVRADVDPVTRRRARREARAQARVSHPSVVQVFDVGEVNGSVFIAMELVRGQTLRQWLAAEHPQPAQILSVFLAAARGLIAAHRQGLVHRDVKPGNILVADNGDVKVADFGLAVAPRALLDPWTRESGLPEDEDDRITDCGITMGTPRYMAPEQSIAEDVDERSDQYAFCVTLFEALAGHPPFSAADSGALLALKRDGLPAALPASISASVASVLRRGMAPQPHGRFESMRALAEALRRAHGVVDRSPTRRRRRWLGAAGFALLAAGAVALVAGGRPAPQAPTPPVSASAPAPQVRVLVDRAAGARAQGALDEAHQHASDAYRWAHRHGSAQDVAHAATALAEVTQRQGHFAEAFEYRRRVYFSALQRDQPAEAAEAAVIAVELLARAGDPTAARRWELHARAEIEHLGDAELRAQLSLSTAIRALAEGNPAEGATAATAALSAAVARFGETSLEAGVAANQLGLARLALGDPAGARVGFRKAEAAMVEHGREAEPTFATLQSNLGIAAYTAGDCEVAAKHYAVADALLRKLPTRAASDLGRVVANQAVCDIESGAYDLGLERLDEAERLLSTDFPPGHPNLRSLAMNRAWLHHKAGDLQRARHAYERVRAEQVEALGTEHVEVAHTEWSLGALLREAGDAEASVRILEHSTRVFATLVGADASATVATRIEWARSLVDAGQPAQALAALTEETRREGHKESRWARLTLIYRAAALEVLGRRAEQQATFREVAVLCAALDRPDMSGACEEPSVLEQNI